MVYSLLFSKELLFAVLHPGEVVDFDWTIETHRFLCFGSLSLCEICCFVKRVAQFQSLALRPVNQIVAVIWLTGVLVFEPVSLQQTAHILTTLPSCLLMESVCKVFGF